MADLPRCLAGHCHSPFLPSPPRATSGTTAGKILPNHNRAFPHGVFSIFQPGCMAIIVQGSSELGGSCLVEERIATEATQEWLPRDAGVAYHNSIFALVWKITVENRQWRPTGKTFLSRTVGFLSSQIFFFFGSALNSPKFKEMRIWPYLQIRSFRCPTKLM